MTISLQQLRLASPCSVKWDDMAGDHRTRFCAQCQLNVYDVVALTEAEVRELIVQSEGKFCGRLYLRRDGTIVTRDCPIGLAMLRRGWWWTLGKAAAAIALIGSGAAWAINYAHPGRPTPSLADARPLDTIVRWLQDQQPVMQYPGGIRAPLPRPMLANSPANATNPEVDASCP